MSQGLIPSRGKIFFVHYHNPYQFCDPPRLWWVLWLFTQGHETEHSPPCSASVKVSSRISTPVCLHDVQLIKLRDNYSTFCFLILFIIFSAASLFILVPELREGCHFISVLVLSWGSVMTQNISVLTATKLN
jgi:hypothetical protein